MLIIIFVLRPLLFVASLLGVSLVLLGCGQQEPTLDFSTCKGDDFNTIARCISGQVDKSLASDPRPEVVIPAAEKAAASAGPEVLGFCHGAMHLTGERFARQKKVSLVNLQQYLPKSEGTSCTAGFVHGLFIAMRLDPNKSQATLRRCAEEKTKMRQYSCAHGLGHSFRRNPSGRANPEKAAASCAALPAAAALECATGVYHDYFLASSGFLGARKSDSQAPEKFCAGQGRFAGQCWFLYLATLKPPVAAEEPVAYVKAVCAREKGAARKGCIAGAVAKQTDLSSLAAACKQLAGRDFWPCLSVGQSLSWSSLVASDNQLRRQTTSERIEQRRQQFGSLLNQCSTLPRADQGRCVYLIALLSIRSYPDYLAPAEAASICAPLPRRVAGACNRAVTRAGGNILEATL